MISGNPKLRRREGHQWGWYRYYPGFSERFVRDALESACPGDGEWVLNPWNGSPTRRANLISGWLKTTCPFSVLSYSCSLGPKY